MISNRDDPHAALGVERTATPAEISHAYRDLLRRHHPDTRTTDDDHAHDHALKQVLHAYADLHRGNRSGPNDHDQLIRHPLQPADPRNQPIVVLGHVDPPIAVTPTRIGHYSNKAARPTPINLLIALLEALPRDPR
jgi:hypothetical protein